MRSVWEECTVDTGAPAPPPPDDGERNDVAELSIKEFIFQYQIYAFKGLLNLGNCKLIILMK